MKKFLPAALFTAVLTLLIYLPVPGFSPVNLDEQQFFVDQWQQLSRGNSVADAFSRGVFETGGTFYRPALTLSFMADARRSGATFTPKVFYATNLALHALNAVLAFALLAALGFTAELSAAGALLFALHPAIAGAVAWIPGRNDPLLFLFAAGSLLALTAAARRRSPALLALHLALFFLALITKETAVALAALFPPWALLTGACVKGPLKDRKPAILAALGWALCLAVYFYLRSAAVHESAPYHGLMPLLARSAAYSSYIFLPLATPVYAWFGDIPALRLWAVNAAALALLGAGLYKARSALGALAALAGLAFIFPSAFSDRFIPHRAYLPAFFLALALTAAASAFYKERRRLVLAAAGLIIILFAAGARRAMYRFDGPQAFWSAAGAASPSSSEADYELGYLAQQNGNGPEAERRYLAALAKNPSAPDARNNLGVLYRGRGRNAEALRLYMEELALEPGKPQTLGNIGNLYASTGRLAEAAEYYKKRLAADPYSEKTYEILIECLIRTGRAGEAGNYARALAALKQAAR